MAEKIIVATKTVGELKDMMGAVEKIAKRGQEVAFLIPYRDDKVGWFQAHLAATQIDSSTMFTAQAIAEQYSWEAQSRSAEQSVAALRKALKCRGVGVTVRLYRGTMKQAVKNLTSTGDIQLVILPAGSGGKLAKLLYGLKVGLLGQNHLSPVRVLSFQLMA